MLVAIVVAENGPLGRECGVGTPRHWSRQFAHDPALSCYAQINATADILDRRYRGSVAAFASPWVQPNQRKVWVSNVRAIKAKVMRKTNAAGEVRRNAVTSTGLLAVSESGDK